MSLQKALFGVLDFINFNVVWIDYLHTTTKGWGVFALGAYCSIFSKMGFKHILKFQKISRVYHKCYVLVMPFHKKMTSFVPFIKKMKFGAKKHFTKYIFYLFSEDIKNIVLPQNLACTYRMSRLCAKLLFQIFLML
jgi:hypothetical protein